MTKSPYIVGRLVAATGCLLGAGVLTYFLASNRDLYTNWWYWACVPLDIAFGMFFIVSMRQALRYIYKVEPHFEVITKKGAKLYGDEIRVTLDGLTALVINKEAQQYLSIENIKWVDDVSESGTKRMTWGQFLIKMVKE